MTFSLPKKTCILWQLRIVIAFSFLCVAVAFLGRFISELLLVSLIIAAFGLIFSFVYIPFYFKSYKITVADSYICITKGVLFTSTNIMPYPRLVFAQSFATPLSCILKMKCVMLKAARGWILIPEIENTNAEFLLENLRVKPNV